MIADVYVRINAYGKINDYELLDDWLVKGLTIADYLINDCR